MQIFLDALGFSQEIGRVLLGQLDKFFERLHRRLEFIGELLVFLVLPGVAQRAEARLEHHQPVFEVGVEPLQLVRKPPDFFRIHDCLCHSVTFR